MNNSWLEETAREHPDQTAVIDPAQSTRLSYRQLHRTVQITMGRLGGLDLQPGDWVGLLMKNRLEFVKIFHACLEAGLVLVPFHTGQTASELQEQVKRLPLRVLIGESTTERRMSALEGTLPLLSVDEPGFPEIESFNQQDRASLAYRTPSPHDPCLVMFTSGTTGEPKAVVLSRQNLRAAARGSAARLGASPEDLWCSPLPFYHMGGISPLYRSVLQAHPVLIGGTDVETADRIFSTYPISGVSLVPSVLQDWFPVIEEQSLESLRFILLGGGPIPPSLVERCRERDLPVFPTYGMTETTSQVATARPGEAYENSRTAGRPLEHCQVQIVNDQGDTVPPDTTGEIVVSGPSVFRGYYEEPALNRRRFGPLGFHTSDRGRFDREGLLYIHHRLSDRIVTGGETVDPEEVRTALLEHPRVQDAAVFGRDHERWGEEVCALVVTTPDTDSDVEQFTEFLKGQLASFKIPRTITRVERIPRTASGTLSRPRARDMVLSEQPSG